MNVLKPHISLNVSSVDASVAFYEKMVEAPRTGVNASHFGIQVASTDDVHEAKRRFETAAGQAEPTPRCAPGLCMPRKSAHAGT